jgi:hypothetical protein
MFSPSSSSQVRGLALVSMLMGVVALPASALALGNSRRAQKEAKSSTQKLNQIAAAEFPHVLLLVNARKGSDRAFCKISYSSRLARSLEEIVMAESVQPQFFFDAYSLLRELDGFVENALVSERIGIEDIRCDLEQRVRFRESGFLFDLLHGDSFHRVLESAQQDLRSKTIAYAAVDPQLVDELNQLPEGQVLSRSVDDLVDTFDSQFALNRPLPEFVTAVRPDGVVAPSGALLRALSKKIDIKEPNRELACLRLHALFKWISLAQIEIPNVESSTSSRPLWLAAASATVVAAEKTPASLICQKAVETFDQISSHKGRLSRDHVIYIPAQRFLVRNNPLTRSYQLRYTDTVSFYDFVKKSDVLRFSSKGNAVPAYDYPYAEIGDALATDKDTRMIWLDHVETLSQN